MFIEIFPEKVKEITYSGLTKNPDIPAQEKGGGYLQGSRGGYLQGSRGGYLQGTTYTETTSPVTTFTEVKGNDYEDEKSLKKSLPFSPKKEGNEAKQKYPLKKEQQPYLDRMSAMGLGCDEATLAVLIRTAFKN